MSLSLSELESAAIDVINILKGIPEFEEQRIAIIGGMALWKYLPKGRSTEDVDFIITLDGPKSVKPVLLNLENSPFVEHAQWFYYRASNGKLVQVDFVAQWQAAYFPSTARKVKDIPSGVLPLITPEDLVVSKIFSCGMRGDKAKSRRDADDAARLLDIVTQSTGNLKLAKHQLDAVQAGLADVIRHTDHDEAWWKSKLGLISA